MGDSNLDACQGLSAAGDGVIVHVMLYPCLTPGNSIEKRGLLHVEKHT